MRSGGFPPRNGPRLPSGGCLTLRSDGREADNQSLLPHDYGENLAIVLAAILAGGVLRTLTRAARERRTQPG